MYATGNVKFWMTPNVMDMEKFFLTFENIISIGICFV